MGLFDEVKVDFECDAKSDGLYQTKDLACAMSLYTINAAGRLIHHHHNWQETPKNELPYPDMPIIGCLRVLKGSEKDIDMNYHGWLDLGEFRVKFTDGTVVDVQRVTD